MMRDKTVLENVIEMRSKYKAELDGLPQSSMNTIRRQLLSRVVNDLTDILCADQERRSDDAETNNH